MTFGTTGGRLKTKTLNTKKVQGLAEDDEVDSVATESDLGHKDSCNGFTDSPLRCE